jgi:hypothetical protein
MLLLRQKVLQIDVKGIASYELQQPINNSIWHEIADCPLTTMTV